jgi:hypothetical protein
MLTVPATQYFAIVVFIKSAVLVVAVLVVAFAMTFSLCKCDAAVGKKYRQGGRDGPFSYFHEDS